jgi:AraC family transcriptional regulator
MRREASARQTAKVAAHRIDHQGPRIELIVDGERHPFCARNRLLRESGRFWRGYRLEHVSIPPSGTLERVSAPDHLLFFVAAGTCDIRYRTDMPDARRRLSLGSFCFVSRGYEFERLSWKGSRSEAIVVAIRDIGADPNPIDAFGRTDALFDVYIGVQDARVSTLLDLMRSEIESGCPTGTTYAEALSLALASRVASLCASAPDADRRIAPLSSRQLARITEHIGKNLSEPLTIDRLAAVANMSPFHFARCFKQTTGMAPHQFVIRERVVRARKMLASTELPIGDIAMSLGFASQSHFTDVYRRITGRTPRRDRSSS